jgi:hypothetical protein
MNCKKYLIYTFLVLIVLAKNLSGAESMNTDVDTKINELIGSPGTGARPSVLRFAEERRIKEILDELNSKDKEYVQLFLSKTFWHNFHPQFSGDGCQGGGLGSSHWQSDDSNTTLFFYAIFHEKALLINALIELAKKHDLLDSMLNTKITIILRKDQRPEYKEQTVFGLVKTVKIPVSEKILDNLEFASLSTDKWGNDQRPGVALYQLVYDFVGNRGKYEGQVEKIFQIKFDAGNTILHHAASHHKSGDVFEKFLVPYLLNKIQEENYTQVLNTKNDNGDAMIHLAISNEQQDVGSIDTLFSRIKSRGPTLQCLNEKGFTAAELATGEMKRKTVEIVGNLVEKTPYGKTPKFTGNIPEIIFVFGEKDLTTSPAKILGMEQTEFEESIQKDGVELHATAANLLSRLKEAAKESIKNIKASGDIETLINQAKKLFQQKVATEDEDLDTFLADSASLTGGHKDFIFNFAVQNDLHKIFYKKDCRNRTFLHQMVDSISPPNDCIDGFKNSVKLMKEKCETCYSIIYAMKVKRYSTSSYSYAPDPPDATLAEIVQKNRTLNSPQSGEEYILPDPNETIAIDKIDEKIAEHEAEFLERRAKKVDDLKGIDHLETKLQSLKSRLGELKKNLTDLRSKLESLKTAVGSL